jgi:hypothetical protein
MDPSRPRSCPSEQVHPARRTLRSDQSSFHFFVDELKVDISFVRSMVESRQSRKITAAVISLGLSLGLQTVAEGVEEQSQANLLAWQGCTFGQGYLYGRPIPAAELPASLSQCHPGVWATTEVPASIGDPFLSLGVWQRFGTKWAILLNATVSATGYNEMSYFCKVWRLSRRNRLRSRDVDKRVTSA